MATRRSQRIFIWIITLVMIVGTLFSFIVMILGTNNSQQDQARINQLTADYQKETDAWQKKVDAQTKELSDKYYATFVKYKSVPAAFASNDVKKLSTKDPKVGTGKTIKDAKDYSAYYIVWNAKGDVCQQSIDGKKLSAPIDLTQGSIEGWEKGVQGMKIGGVRELTIPGSLAYPDQDQGDCIKANAPLKFIVMAIPHVEQIPQPQPSAELLQYYQSGGVQ